MGEHTAESGDGRVGRLLRLGVVAAIVAAAGCAWLLVSAFGGDPGSQGPQSTGCDRLCGSGTPGGSPGSVGDPSASASGGGRPAAGTQAPPGSPGDTRSGQTIAPGAATPPPGSAGGAAGPGASAAFSSPSTVSGQLVRFTVTSQWSTGYRMAVTVTNQGTVPITDWALSFHVTGATLALPPDQPTVSQTGQTVEWLPGDWETTIKPGQSWSVGFNFDGPVHAPTQCVFAGAACTFVQQAPAQ